MAKRRIIPHKTIDDLLMVADTAIESMIPHSSDGKNKDVLYSIEIAYASDRDWFEYITKTRQVKHMKDTIDNVIRTAFPHAILLCLYRGNEKEPSFSYAVKLENKHIPVMDDEIQPEKERYQKNTIREHINPEGGLGSLGTFQVQRMQDKLEQAEREYDKDLDNLRKELENNFRFEKLTLQNKITKLTEDNAILKEQKSSLEKDMAEALSVMDEYEDVIAESKSKEGVNDFKNVALMGLAAKILDVEPSELKGLIGGDNGSTETQPITEKAGGLIEEDEDTRPDRKEDIVVIKSFLNSCEEKTFRKIITVLQAIHQDVEKLDIIISLLTEN